MIDFETLKAIILTNNFTDEQLVELHHTVKIARNELVWQQRQYTPVKMNRIAAVLIGYSRLLGSFRSGCGVTLHQHFHRYFSTFAENVDYYVLSWIPVDFGSKQTVVPLFQNLWPNTLFYKLYDDQNLNFNTHHKTLKLTYLAKMASEEIRKVESRGRFVYDSVIETRLDNYMKHHNFRNVASLKENEIVAHAGHMGAKAPGRKWDSKIHSIDDFEMPGWYFRMDSPTYHNLSDRFAFFIDNYAQLFPEEHSNNIHKDMAYYFKENPQYTIANHDDFIAFCVCVTLDSMPPL